MNTKKYLKQILVAYKHEDCVPCMSVAREIERYGFTYKAKSREKVTKRDIAWATLIIVVGGDGTTLRISHLIQDTTPVFSVNGHPKQSEGFITQATVHTFKDHFKDFVEGKTHLVKLPRVQVSVNKKIISQVGLNEVALLPRTQQDTFVHKRKHNGKHNVEKSSGVLVCTPMGSTAWCKSAGGKQMKLTDKHLQFVVREPYFGSLYTVKEVNAFGTSFQLTALRNGIIVFDASHKTYSFKKNDVLTVSKSKQSLVFVMFDRKK